MMKKSSAIALSCMIGMSGVLAACSKSGSEVSTAGKEANKPVEINIMSDFYSPEPPSDQDPIRLEIEKKTNTKLNITWVSPNNYGDKTNVTLASGDLPELMLIREPFQAQIRKMADQGAFWDLTPLLKDYKNLSAFPAESWKNTSLNGKNYGIPFTRPLYGTEGMPILRKDWLDQLGMQPPKNLDEMYAVMQAFTEKDPDGNGKKDTIGLTATVNANNMGSLSWVENVLNGNYGKWKEQDDKLIDMTFEKGTKDALIWLAMAYKEGLLAADFPTLKNSQVRESITTNKVGIFTDALKPTWLLTGQMRAANPKADLLQLSSLEGPQGKFAPKGSGAFGFWVIPKSVPEAKLKQILAFMDYGATQEGSVMANFGFKGEHYNEQDGMYLFTEKAKVYTGVIFPIFQSLDKYAFAYQTGIPADFLKRNMSIIDEQAKVATGDPAIGLNSDTYNKVGIDYDKRTQDLKVKIIFGREPIEAWDTYTASFKADAQYQKIVTEFNDDYKKRQAK
ncbi:extracellular solute-binding protein [Paenibacillus sp. WQ 127069]|uniref:Extracellular solute-binding protein n=1 Tax=Paenibacillus baimaensis TaxID=2982185 RepID=A0ABT2U7N4_9BACL|nr:extracellular solute-binding protein [Paenibacillus sp. WQ 127069]MCU6790637.1 extracellular solute-binding protein [Paenibacillus sp. WQ 127069]